MSFEVFDPLSLGPMTVTIDRRRDRLILNSRAAARLRAANVSRVLLMSDGPVAAVSPVTDGLDHRSITVSYAQYNAQIWAPGFAQHIGGTPGRYEARWLEDKLVFNVEVELVRGKKV